MNYLVAKGQSRFVGTGHGILTHSDHTSQGTVWMQILDQVFPFSREQSADIISTEKKSPEDEIESVCLLVTTENVWF